MIRTRSLPPALPFAAPARTVARRAARAAALAAAAAVLPLSAAPPTDAAASSRPRAAADSYPPEAPYSLALHMHGSMSEQFGSWEWHAAKAESLGVDVVWWTDHDWRLTNWRHTNRYDFESAFWEPDSFRWKEPDDQYAGGFRYWQTDSSNAFLLSALCDTLAAEGTRSLRLEAQPGAPGPEFEGGLVEQTASEVQNKYSLAKRVRLAFAVFPETLDAADARFVLEAELSDHPDGTHVLRYVVGSMAGEGVHSRALPWTPGVWNAYEVDVTADAIAAFTSGGADSLRGEDNSLASVKIGVETRNGAAAVAFFDDYRILPDPAMVGDVLLDRGRAMGAYYETLHPSVKHYHGSEISKFKAQPHLNAFAPDHVLVDYTGHVYGDTLYYAIDQVHAQGGAVSLNHTFGPKFDYQFDPDETPVQQFGRLQWTKRQMIGCRAYGVDMLEVGYRRRGGMDLVHHLDLWDALTGNAVFVTGNGVTDSHGRGFWNLDGWGPSELGLAWIDNFVTWLHTEEFSEAGFCRAMRSGRAYFGDPYRWDGALDMRTLDGFRMGQVVTTDRDAHHLVVEITDLAADAQVRLRQGEVREDPPAEYIDVHWIRDEVLDGANAGGTFADTVTVDTTVPCFVRLEVTDATGGELVYGNPIHFLRDVPARGTPAERVGVRLGDVRVFLADGLTLTGASLAGAVLTLTLDEAIAGSGMLRLDPGTLGVPAAVNGADAWSVSGGIVTLTGFSGAGSVVNVIWSGTAAAAPLPAAGEALRLDPPRPNPADGAAVIDYALPREGWVRLEVLDVSGRRIRVLGVGFQPAGGRRVTWDGRDEGGSPVAAGVYWVRLEHDGETATRKLARLR